MQNTNMTRKDLAIILALQAEKDLSLIDATKAVCADNGHDVETLRDAITAFLKAVTKPSTKSKVASRKANDNVKLYSFLKDAVCNSPVGATTDDMLKLLNNAITQLEIREALPTASKLSAVLRIGKGDEEALTSVGTGKKRVYYVIGTESESDPRVLASRRVEELKAQLKEANSGLVDNDEDKEEEVA